MKITMDEQTIVVICIMLIFIYKENFILIFHNIIQGLYISLCDINRFYVCNNNYPFTQNYMHSINAMSNVNLSMPSMSSMPTLPSLPSLPSWPSLQSQSQTSSLSSNSKNTYDNLEYNSNDGRFYLYNSTLPKSQGNPIVFNYYHEYLQYVNTNNSNGIYCPVLEPMEKEKEPKKNNITNPTQTPYSSPYNKLQIQYPTTYSDNNNPFLTQHQNQHQNQNQNPSFHSNSNSTPNSNSLMSANAMDSNWGGVPFSRMSVFHGDYIQ